MGMYVRTKIRDKNNVRNSSIVRKIIKSGKPGYEINCIRIPGIKGTPT
jgi:hypothetical protein